MGIYIDIPVNFIGFSNDRNNKIEELEQTIREQKVKLDENAEILENNFSLYTNLSSSLMTSDDFSNSDENLLNLYNSDDKGNTPREEINITGPKISIYKVDDNMKLEPTSVDQIHLDVENPLLTCGISNTFETQVPDLNCDAHINQILRTDCKQSFKKKDKPKEIQLYAYPTLLSEKKLECLRNYKHELKNIYANIEDYNFQVESETNINANPYEDLLSKNEMSLKDNDPHFSTKLDNAILDDFVVSSNLSTKEKYMLYNLFYKHSSLFPVVDKYFNKVVRNNIPKRIIGKSCAEVVDHSTFSKKGPDISSHYFKDQNFPLEEND